MTTGRGHLVPPERPERVYLGLGGNQGDRLQALRRGLFALSCHPEIQVDVFSPVWETEYVGPGRQDPYLNLVVGARTELAPAALLAVCKGIEQRLGRAADGHLKPRTLDIDILLFGDRTGSDDMLTLPHPRLNKRGFVLAPLAQIAPEAPVADSGETARAAWARMRAEDGPWLRPWPEPIVSLLAEADCKEDWRAALAVHCR